MKARLLAAFTAALVLSAQAADAGTEHTVTLTAIDDYKAVFAKVESTDVIPARARIAGTVDKLSVDEGSMVEQGQSIAVVRDRKLTLQLAALDARIKSLQAQRELAQIALDRAEASCADGGHRHPGAPGGGADQSRRHRSEHRRHAGRTPPSPSQQRKDGEILAPTAGPGAQGPRHRGHGHAARRTGRDHRGRNLRAAHGAAGTARPATSASAIRC